MSVRNLNLSKTNKTATTTFGVAYYIPGGACGWRTQPDFQIVVILKGSAEVYLNKEAPLRLGTGEAILLRPYTQELILFDRKSETHHTWISVTASAVPDSLQERIYSSPNLIHNTSTVNQLIEIGMKEQDHILIDQLGIAGLAAFCAVRSKPVRTSLLNALEYIDTNLARPMTVDQVADAAFVSPQHLARLFKSEFNTTPSRYIWETRTKKGLELLRSTGLSISEISYQLGFQSPFHFSRLVRQATGEAPKVFREKQWNPKNSP
jgi:AraC-like DNA-binding protein